MRWGQRVVPMRPVLALFAAGIAVASCTTVESVLAPMGNIFSQPQQPAKPPGETECPQVTVRTGAATWQVPPGAAATALRYQATLGQLARECAVLGETMTVKVGIEGRLLVGPRGGPGNVNVPVRIALVHEGPQPRSIWTKFYNIPVTVAGRTTQATFAQVEDDLTFPMPQNPRDLDQYIIYVGFDPQGAPPTRTKQKGPAKSKPKPKPKEKQAPPPAPAAQPQQPGFAPPPGTFSPPPPPPGQPKQ